MKTDKEIPGLEGLPQLPPLEKIISIIRKRPDQKKRVTTVPNQNDRLEIIIVSEQELATQIEGMNSDLKPYEVPYTNQEVALRAIQRLEQKYPNSRLNYFWTFPPCGLMLERGNKREQILYKILYYKSTMINPIWLDTINGNKIFIWDREIASNMHLWGLNTEDISKHQLSRYNELIMHGIGIGGSRKDTTEE